MIGCGVLPDLAVLLIKDPGLDQAPGIARRVYVPAPGQETRAGPGLPPPARPGQRRPHAPIPPEPAAQRVSGPRAKTSTENGY